MEKITTESRFSEDIKRIIKVGLGCGYVLTPEEADDLWVEYSNAVFAGWLVLPKEDEVLKIPVEAYIMEKMKRRY